MSEDNIVFGFLSRLRKDFPNIDFVEFDPTEDLDDALSGAAEKTVYIIDVVEGIDEVKVIDDLDSIEDSPKYSAHDYDLAFDLKMLRKLGRIKGAVIFGVPAEGDEGKIFEELRGEIRKVR